MCSDYGGHSNRRICIQNDQLVLKFLQKLSRQKTFWGEVTTISTPGFTLTVSSSLNIHLNERAIMKMTINLMAPGEVCTWPGNHVSAGIDLLRTAGFWSTFSKQLTN